MTYSFDKSSKKYICPNCNKKRFVRYVDETTNEYLNEIYGRCDRETNCGYFKKPESSIATPSNNIAKPSNNIAIPNLKASNNKENISFHAISLLQESLNKYCNNNFYTFLKEIFKLEEIQNTFNRYKIGTSKTWNGATVFWQIDNDLKIRAGKIILFEKSNCKRVKEPFPHITWVHSKLKLDNFNLKQCLFGLHLINSSNKIAIVESEKTAIIMALFMPEYTWMATGSKQNFKNDILYPIKNKEIIAFPDKSEYKDWLEKAKSLNSIGYNIKVSDYVEKKECETGTDLADLYIEIKTKVSQKQLTDEEKEIKRLASINPELLNLIETFELCDKFDNIIKTNLLNQKK